MAAGTDINNDGQAQYEAHNKSYALFTSVMKWSTIISFGFAAFVVFVLIA